MRLLDIYLSIKQQRLDEANLKNLYTGTLNETPKLAQRGAQLNSAVRYFGLSEDGTLNFKIRSQSVPGRFYYAYIEAPDMLKFGDVIEQGDHFNTADLARLLTMNGFRVHCSDPSFLYYGFQYKATQGNYEIQPETRAPKRNNVLLRGNLCKHMVAVIYNLYNNDKMREQLSRDIDNYLRMLEGLDYEDYQQLNHARQIQQQNRAVKWKDNPTDYMNDYFARQAKHHPFLDDHDIKKSLRSEVTKFAHANPTGTVDDFLRSYFNMTEKAFSEDMQIPEESVEDYFDELGLTKKQQAQLDRNERKEQQQEPEEITTEDISTDTDNTKSNILTNDSERPTGTSTEVLKESDSEVTSSDLNNNPCKFVTYGSAGRHEVVCQNIKDVFKYIDDCGGLNQFKEIRWFILSNYNDGEYYYVRDYYARGGWKWIDQNGENLSDYKYRSVRGLNESEGKILYRGYSNTKLDSYCGAFFADNELDASNYGDKVMKVQLSDKAKIYKGLNSYTYCKNNNLLNKKYETVYDITGCNTLQEVYDIYMNWVKPSYLDKNPNLYFRAFQKVAKDELSKSGYDGAEWTDEDEMIPHQFQIWNQDIIKPLLTESDLLTYYTPKQAHQEYQKYLEGHINNVQKAMDLIIKISPDDEFIQENQETLRNIAKEHDKSKYGEDEYIPYLHHFYPTNEQEEQQSEEFELACKHHILHNKHHWDYWIDPSTLELPTIEKDDRQYKLFCVERVCDWLAMAAQHDETKDLWYESNKAYMKMPDWAFDYIEELYRRVPDDFYLNLPFHGTRGEKD